MEILDADRKHLSRSSFLNVSADSLIFNSLGMMASVNFIMKFTIYFSPLKVLRKQDAKADETEELMRNKLVKYESEKHQVRLNFFLSVWF